jgi:hypothetical protein
MWDGKLTLLRYYASSQLFYHLRNNLIGFLNLGDALRCTLMVCVEQL